MAKAFYKETKFRTESLELIRRCNEIVYEFVRQNLRLTLRQLYYQLVTRNIIRNEERAYKNLSNLVSGARLAGLIDWDAIEDRIRVPAIPPEWNDIAELVKDALDSYRLPRWKGQSNYVELWVEKDALAGVLSPIASEFHAPLMVNRGYSSQSAMHEAAGRFIREKDRDQKIILYLGDFDPSGEDMVRDIAYRMEMFQVDVHVRKIALTLAQVKKYKPPPNPAKLTDPRSKEFIAQYGASSWEVDAINPAELRKIIIKEFGSLIDRPKMQAIVEKETADKNQLREVAQKIMEGR
jgi:hypothetical protein